MDGRRLMDSIPSKEEEDEEEEREPLLSTRPGDLQESQSQQQLKKTGSHEIATFFNFAKASIGSGSFALPWGILQAGILIGGLGMVLLGILSVYTMQLMLECKRFVTRSLPPKERQSLNYTELGRIAMGPFGKWAVNISVLGCNLGVCAGYMIFISSNLQWAFTCISVRTPNEVYLTTWEIYAMILPILILLTLLPSFKLLAYAAYIGAIFLAVAMVVVYWYGAEQEFCALQNGVHYLPSSGLGVAQWFGVTAFLFCVHSMVIPLESTMKRPGNMPYVLDLAAVVVVGVNLPFALYGYFLFGNQTEGYIFENMPGNWFNDVVRLLLSLELTLTFPIVFKPASEVTEEIWHNFMMFVARVAKLDVIHFIYPPTLYQKQHQHLKYKIIHQLIRAAIFILLVLISWGVAVGIPRFELCLALVGSLTTTVLAFILPPLFHVVLKGKYVPVWRNVLHVVMLVLGVLAAIAATSINLYQAIEHPSTGVNKTVLIRQCNATSLSCYGE